MTFGEEGIVDVLRVNNARICIRSLKPRLGTEKPKTIPVFPLFLFFVSLPDL
jgi:hypothetical protein